MKSEIFFFFKCRAKPLARLQELEQQSGHGSPQSFLMCARRTIRCATNTLSLWNTTLPHFLRGKRSASGGPLFISELPLFIPKPHYQLQKTLIPLIFLQKGGLSFQSLILNREDGEFIWGNKSAKTTLPRRLKIVHVELEFLFKRVTSEPKFNLKSRIERIVKIGTQVNDFYTDVALK